MLKQALLCLLCFLAGVGLLYAWWTDALAVIAQQVTVEGLVLGILLVGLAPLGLAAVLWQGLRGDCLVIARDRLQVVKTRNGEDVVVLQIPYRNLAEISADATPQGKQVGIALKDVDDPNTYRERPFEDSTTADGWHYAIDAGYQLTPQAIYEAVLGNLNGPRAH